MKGPGLRLLIDVRRAWKCPRCGYEEHVGAEVTTVGCPCCPGVYMKLCETRKTHADQLQRLRERPMPVTEAMNAEIEGLPLVEVQPSDSGETTSSAPASSTMESSSSPPAKRRGKRPRKQSRRGQHKQQTQAANQPADSEE